MGAKKGLGATKIQTNFEDIEREAQLADSMRSQKKQEAPTVEEAESQVKLFHDFKLSNPLLILPFYLS